MDREPPARAWFGMFAGRPIIGLAGGIGSGKSFVAALFAEMGCAVIDSDAQARAAYGDPAVLRKLREWWGDAVFRPDGTPDRARIAQIIFTVINNDLDIRITKYTRPTK